MAHLLCGQYLLHECKHPAAFTCFTKLPIDQHIIHSRLCFGYCACHHNTLPSRQADSFDHYGRSLLPDVALCQLSIFEDLVAASWDVVLPAQVLRRQPQCKLADGLIPKGWEVLCSHSPGGSAMQRNARPRKKGQATPSETLWSPPAALQRHSDRRPCMHRTSV